MSSSSVSVHRLSVVLLLAICFSGISVARPALSFSRQRTEVRLEVLAAIKMTKKSYDLDICSKGISLYLSRKKINTKNSRFTLMDARKLLPMLHAEQLTDRVYVWCRTAELYQSLSQGQRNKFDITSLNHFQGDIVLNRVDVDLILGQFFPTKDRRIEAFDAARKFWTQRSPRRRVKRKLVPFPEQHWPDAVVYYKISRADFTPITIDSIAEAIATWEKDTCIRFKESKNRFFQPHINFRKGSGCSSAIGVNPHGQSISVGDGCESVGVISHEIGHSLGFYHEQSRPDRDQYVEIIKDNINGVPFQFSKIAWDAGMTLGIPYDYSSVMHYRSTDFSIDDLKPTIMAKEPDMNFVMGQREGPSFLDVKLANRNYCSHSCSSTTLEWDECKNDGYRNPNDCNSCVCPRGLAPPRCEGPSKGINENCGQQVLMATQNEQILLTPGYNLMTGFNSNAFCPWMIKASTPGKRVRLQFTGKFAFTEDPVVCEDYAEVRYKDISRAGPRFCTETVPERVFRSHGPEMLVFAHSLQVSWWQGFQAIYAEENCGRCSADAGDDEPSCLRTEKYDCSPENLCDHEGCPPPRKNYCYRDEEYCCSGVLVGNRCRALRSTTTTTTTAKPTTTTTSTTTTTPKPTTTTTSTTTTTPKPTTTTTSTTTTTPKPTTTTTSTTTTTHKPTTTTTTTTTPKPVQHPSGIWSSWSAWSSCSATCGKCGERSRTRTCPRPPCRGTSAQTKVCGSGQCPVRQATRSYTCTKTVNNCSMGWFIKVKKNCQKTTICTVLEDTPACCLGTPFMGQCI